jgi:hypothetical protein
MPPNLIRRVFSGYAAILKPILFILALLAASAALSFAIAWPLWFFATRQRTAYSFFTLAVLAATACILAISARARKIAANGSPTNARKRPAIFALFAVIWICILAAGSYFSVLLSVRGLAYIGVPFLIILLILLGLAAWRALKKK